MPEILLRTKLSVPPLRASLVLRPHLIERLDQWQQLGHKLTLISAPAGFGKTTLICEWVGNLRLDTAKESQSNNRCAWLSLDEGDNDPTRFLVYFVTALKQIEGIETTFGDSTLSMLRSPQPPLTNVILASLINEVTDIPDRIVLVLDDYHSIESASVDDALTFLLEHLPPQMHLIIATRDDPNLQISRLRGRGQLTELRAADLRFSASEAAEFLNQVMGLNLSSGDITELETRTEGWIAGLQLAAISMQGHEDRAGFIKSFTGSHRLVLDYLIEEVLEQQPQDIQTFLLKTSILNRLTGSLCDALTNQENSRAIFEMLDRANLFIIPLDEERCWYRYHHLFRDLLKSRLQQTWPEKIDLLQKKASDWFKQNGFIDEAIEYALKAEDYDKAIGLIESIADAVWINGEHKKLAGWLNAIPKKILYIKPNLCIFQASSLYIMGQQREAEKSLESVEQKIGLHWSDDFTQEDHSPIANENRRLLGRIATTRAVMGYFQGDIPNLIQNANLALEYLPEEDLPWRSSAANALADAQIFIGNLPEAYRTRVEAIEISKAAGDKYPLMIAYLKLANVLRYQGQIHQVLDICEEQMQFSASSGMSNPAAIGILLAIWGEALAEINDLTEALRKATDGLELAEKGGDIASIGWSYICLVRVLCSRGDLIGAEEIIQMMRATSEEHTIPPWIESMLTARQVRIWLLQGDLNRATRWADQLKLAPNTKMTSQNELEYIALARLYTAQNQHDEALKLLESLLTTAHTFGRISREIEILIQIALTYDDLKETDKSLAALEQVLSLAELRQIMFANC